MKSINLQITDEMNNVLTQYSKSIGANRTECIRRAISDYLLDKEKIKALALIEKKETDSIDKSKRSMRLKIRMQNNQFCKLQAVADDYGISISQYTKEVLLQSIDKDVLSKVDLKHINKLILEVQKNNILLIRVMEKSLSLSTNAQNKILHDLKEKYKGIELKYIQNKVEHKNKL